MKTYLESIRVALDDKLKTDRLVLLLGEDIEDPYGGAFKVTKGLSSKYPGRVINTPISEPAIVGVSNGLALRGMKPVVEIMFGDFLTLCADQIINHAAKFRWMYNDKVKVPLTIRTPMGGGRGYGPTHSQSIEKLFFGIPEVTIVSPSIFHDVSGVLTSSIDHLGVVIFAEYKQLYPQALKRGAGSLNKEGLVGMEDKEQFPTLTLSNVPNGNFEEVDFTVLAYGAMATEAAQAIKELMFEEELSCELVIPSVIKPFDYAPLINSLKRSGRLIVVEEAVVDYGFGAEIIAHLCESNFGLLKQPVRRVAGLNCPIASSKQLESLILPDKNGIKKAVLEMCDV
jgi:pyruvate/2-oxoglutarate/acetoin dehydrogenase E1 component